MKTVAVITNNLQAYDYFITHLHPTVKMAFLFKQAATMADVFDTCFVMHIKLSVGPIHFGGDEIEAYLSTQTMSIHIKEPYWFTKESQEILKYSDVK